MTLLFWGWQTGFLLVGALLAVILESALFIKLRWDLADEDFSRIWTFCVVLALAAALFAFVTSDGPAQFGKLFNGPSAAEKQSANNSTIHTATALLRWMPMVMFLFVAAQTFNARPTIPLHKISFILQRRWRKAKREGAAEPPRRDVDVTFPYFILCLFSASVHTNNGSLTFFWGQSVLIVWALWTQRPERFGWPVWAGLVAVGVALGFSGQYGIWKLERMVENYSPQWAERFLQHRADPLKNVTALGRIGRMKLSGTIVIRLETTNGAAPPTYLREASYRNYHSQIWRTGGTSTDFENVTPESDPTTFVLLRKKTNTLSAKIGCYLYGGKALLPLPTGSGRLENLNVFLLQANSEGAVMAEGPGLVQFDAFYGPGETIDSPPETKTNRSLSVPVEEKPALDQVIAEMNLAGLDDMKTRQAVAGFFSKKFQYSLWQDEIKRTQTDETVLANFLLHTRNGHCEFFATATVLLLRELGIPARYAVGYAVHETSGKGYVVRERDAHAWCLVWNEQQGVWEDFDTTPGSWVQIEGQRASFFERFSDAWSWVWFQISKFRAQQSDFRQYILWALVPVLAVLLYQIIFRRGKKRQRQKVMESVAAPIVWAGLDSEFYQLESRLAERGVARLPSESFSDWLMRALADSALADLRQPLQGLLQLHYRHRFDPPGLNREERAVLKSEVQACLIKLAHAKQP